MRRILAATALLLTAIGYVHAHEGDHDHASVVTITIQGDTRIIEANGLPDHQPGRFPNRGNPNTISEQSYHFSMPVSPVANDEPTRTGRYLFGIAINGVVFDPGTAETWTPGQPIADRPSQATRGGRPGPPGSAPGSAPGSWNYEGMGTMNLGIDTHHAHVQPSGAYHYHGLPTGLIARLRRERSKDQMLLIGYAADGFPIYAQYGHEKADDTTSPLKKLQSSYRLRKGARPTGNEGPGGKYDGTFVQDYEYIPDSGDLDQCNGRTGVTPEYPAGTYYYVATDTFPFIPRYFHATPDPSFAKRDGPPGASGGGGRGPGGQRQGGPGEQGRPPRPGPDGPPPQR